MAKRKASNEEIIEWARGTKPLGGCGKTAGSAMIQAEFVCGTARSLALSKLAREAGPIDAPNIQEPLKYENRGDTAEVTTATTDIKTVDEALAYAEIDLDIWEVERSVINKWEVAMKMSKGKNAPDEIKKEMLWQVKVWLRRKMTEPVEVAVRKLAKRLMKGMPKMKSVKYKMPKDPHLLEVSIIDCHFGKLAWHRETLEDYDLRIAEELYANAVEDILHRVSPYNVERILLPIGHDFFHVDDDRGKTPRGEHSLDIEGRLAKIYEVGGMAVIKGILRLTDVAPVDVVFVPGNHDPHMGYFLATMLRVAFEMSGRKGVTVNSEPMARKKYRYGTVLLGLTHRASFRSSGGLSPERLAVMMSTDWKKDWSETRWHEWHIGDQHRVHGVSFTDVNEELGTRVRWLPSLTAQDRWHFEHGFVLQRRAAEAYLWHKEHGYVGHFHVDARGPGGNALDGRRSTAKKGKK